jgi:hypothetical protein
LNPSGVCGDKGKNWAYEASEQIPPETLRGKTCESGSVGLWSLLFDE